PYVRCKLAMSLDGRTAMASGQSKWVTGRKSREDVQRLRARSCATVRSIDTVISHNAALTVRPDAVDRVNAVDAAGRQPLPVILDSRPPWPRSAEPRRHPSPILLVHNGAAENAARLTDWPAHVELLALPDAQSRIGLVAV